MYSHASGFDRALARVFPCFLRIPFQFCQMVQSSKDGRILGELGLPTNGAVGEQESASWSPLRTTYCLNSTSRTLSHVRVITLRVSIRHRHSPCTLTGVNTDGPEVILHGMIL